MQSAHSFMLKSFISVQSCGGLGSMCKAAPKVYYHSLNEVQYDVNTGEPVRTS